MILKLPKIYRNNNILVYIVYFTIHQPEKWKYIILILWKALESKKKVQNQILSFV